MESTNDIRALIEGFKEGYAIFWLHDQIVVRDCPVDLARIDQNALVECRVFDAQEEILIRRRGDSFVYRARTDEQSFVTKKAVLRGEIAMQLKRIDTDLASVDEKKNERISLIKHEYIDYNEQDAATYVDSRFVGFETIKNQENGKVER